MPEKITLLETNPTLVVRQYDFRTDDQNVTIVTANASDNSFSMDIHYPGNSGHDEDEAAYYALGWQTELPEEAVVAAIRDAASKLGLDNYYCSHGTGAGTNALDNSMGESTELDELLGPANITLLRADSAQHAIVWLNDHGVNEGPEFGVISEMPLGEGYLPEFVGKTISEAHKSTAQFTLNALNQVFQAYRLHKPKSQLG